jgi:hypothetical protein
MQQVSSTLCIQQVVGRENSHVGTMSELMKGMVRSRANKNMAVENGNIT